MESVEPYGLSFFIDLFLCFIPEGREGVKDIVGKSVEFVDGHCLIFNIYVQIVPCHHVHFVAADDVRLADLAFS